MEDGLNDMVVQRTAQLEAIEKEIKKDVAAVARVPERFRIIKEEPPRPSRRFPP